MGVYKNIIGTITRVDENGLGFISPTTPVGAHNKDIFFSKDTLEDATVWSQVLVGLKVEVPIVFSRDGSLYAEKVILSSVYANGTEKWIEDIIDKIGFAQYSRLQDHFYTSKYQKIIQGFEEKHYKDIRNLCVFFALVILMFFYLNFTDRDNYPSFEDKSEKVDYSPVGGWTYE
jgi:hypothetical protein